MYGIWRPPTCAHLRQHQYVHTCIANVGYIGCRLYSDEGLMYITLSRLHVKKYQNYDFPFSYWIRAVYIPDSLSISLADDTLDLLTTLPNITLPSAMTTALPEVTLPNVTHVGACTCDPIDLDKAKVGDGDRYYIEGDYYTRTELHYPGHHLYLKLYSQIELDDNDPVIYFETIWNYP